MDRYFLFFYIFLSIALLPFSTELSLISSLPQQAVPLRTAVYREYVLGGGKKKNITTLSQLPLMVCYEKENTKGRLYCDLMSMMKWN